MNVIGELVLDLSSSDQKIVARIFAPQERTPGELWTCRFEIDAPIDLAGDMHGSTSLQTIALALQCLSAGLYGSEEYRSGQLGILGEFGGYLTIPTPQVVSDIAVYPF